MMGSKQRQFAPLIHVSLEDLVPADHFYRHLEKSLDLSFVREFVQQTYAGGYQRMADYFVSTTDPDATLMETTKGADMGYRTHYVVDGGKARIILGVLVTPSEVMDNQPMRDLIFRTRFRWKLRPRHVTGDTMYGTTDNIVALEREHIKAYVPIADITQRTPFFRQEDFHYDAQRDVYLCPAGKELHFCQRQTTQRSRRYRARARDCNQCPLKAKCTTSTQGCSLCRSVDEQYLDQVRGYHSTEPYKKAVRKRQVWVEPLFAEGKDWHGMRRFRLRRLLRFNCEALMRAGGQNLKRLLKKRGWGRRPYPAEELHVPLFVLLLVAGSYCFRVCICFPVDWLRLLCMPRTLFHPGHEANDADPIL